MKIALLAFILTGCATNGVNTAAGFCVTSAGWNGSPTTVVGCNREKGTTGGGITVRCGEQYTITCNDIEKGSTAAVAPKVTP